MPSRYHASMRWHSKCMAQIVDAGTCLAFFRLDAGASKDTRQEFSCHYLRITSCSLLMPEKTRRRLGWCADSVAGIEIRLESGCSAV